jgi:hypothetical protein
MIRRSLITEDLAYNERWRRFKPHQITINTLSMSRKYMGYSVAIFTNLRKRITPKNRGRFLSYINKMPIRGKIRFWIIQGCDDLEVVPLEFDLCESNLNCKFDTLQEILLFSTVRTVETSTKN